jgi:hypothetical protein
MDEETSRAAGHRSAIGEHHVEVCYRAILTRRSRVSSLSIAPSMAITSAATTISKAIIVFASHHIGRARPHDRLISDEQATA